jgi:nucleotide-binding universal stress UspA family protein
MKRTTTKPARTALVRTPRRIKRAAARIAPLHLKQILVPVDFSTFSGRALRHALPMAQRFGAQIVLLHVIELFPIDYMVGTESDTITGVEGRRRAKDDLAKLGAKILESSGVPYRSVIRIGKPFREIVKAARELDADLIVLSTHGRTGLDRFYLGSTAERVVRHAACPVLVVRKR